MKIRYSPLAFLALLICFSSLSSATACVQGQFALDPDTKTIMICRASLVAPTFEPPTAQEWSSYITQFGDDPVFVAGMKKITGMELADLSARLKAIANQNQAIKVHLKDGGNQKSFDDMIAYLNAKTGQDQAQVAKDADTKAAAAAPPADSTDAKLAAIAEANQHLMVVDSQSGCEGATAASKAGPPMQVANLAFGDGTNADLLPVSYSKSGNTVTLKFYWVNATGDISGLKTRTVTIQAGQPMMWNVPNQKGMILKEQMSTKTADEETKTRPLGSQDVTVDPGVCFYSRLTASDLKTITGDTSTDAAK